MPIRVPEVAFQEVAGKQFVRLDQVGQFKDLKVQGRELRLASLKILRVDGPLNGFGITPEGELLCLLEGKPHDTESYTSTGGTLAYKCPTHADHRVYFLKESLPQGEQRQE